MAKPRASKSKPLSKPAVKAAVKPKAVPIIKYTMGVDEAGRGPAIGPMVMAVVVLDSKAAAALSRAGLADSKSYGAGEEAHAVRCELDKQIRARAKFVASIEVEHTEIDLRVSRGELNMLEREHAATLIQQGLDSVERVDRIIADGQRMFAPLGMRFERFESHDRGEEKHAAVAAASVIAKVIRDTRFEQIRARYELEVGPIAGGGYANAHTRKWLRAYCERYGKLPDEARLSWPHPYVEDLIGDVRPPSPQLDLLS